jgi:hypothetical protein
MKQFNLITLSTALAFLLSGCYNSTPTPPEDAIDTTLPVVTLNGHIEDMKSVAFEWKDMNDTRVSGIYVYRNDPTKDDSQITRYATIPNRFSTHYIDNGVTPNTKYQYFFTTFSEKAQSQKSQTVTLSTLPVLESVAWLDSIQNMPRSAKIIWRPHTNPRVNGYVIERKSLKDEDFKEITRVNGRLSAEFIDTKLDDGQVYKYQIRAITFDDIKSTPSQTVQAITKHLPPDIKALAVTHDLPKKIKLNWQSTTISDFDHYNVYRSSSASGSMDLHAKIATNSFVDDIQEDGKQYFYRVTAVDKDGLESDSSIPPLQGITLVKPKAPDLMSAKILANQAAEIKWSDTDSRVKSYTIIKTSKRGWLDSQIDEIRGITDTKYIDANIFAGIEYRYQILAVDEFNISSEPSTEASISSDALPTEASKQKAAQTKQKAAPAVKPASSATPVKTSVQAADLDTGL